MLLPPLVCSFEASVVAEYSFLHCSWMKHQAHLGKLLCFRLCFFVFFFVLDYRGTLIVSGFFGSLDWYDSKRLALVPSIPPFLTCAIGPDTHPPFVFCHYLWPSVALSLSPPFATLLISRIPPTSGPFTLGRYPIPS